MANKTEIIAEPGRQEVFIKREFDAPRELVFRAYTDPDVLIQWLGPKNLRMKIEKNAEAAGQPWRFIHSDENGNEFGFHGVCHELLAPERIIRTFEFEGLPETGHVSLETATFEELPNNRCRVVSQSVFKSVEDRDGMVASGMEQGVKEGYERLDQWLNKQTAAATA
ncbi:MAG TPA: SRPBCC family protein [Pyrinomonadaceae bacterium]